MRRALAVVGFLLIVVGLSWSSRSYTEARPLLITSSPQPVVTTPSAPEPLPTARPAVPATPALETPTPIAVQPAEGAVPSWLSIPAIGIDESVMPQGLTNGKVDPPPGQTIWYNESPVPGHSGTSVFVGHVQWGPTPDNFWRLNEVPDGSPFTITFSDGTVTSWVTVSQLSQSKDDLQNNQEVWVGNEAPVVALITCDKDSPVEDHHHTHNLVVFARPA